MIMSETSSNVVFALLSIYSIALSTESQSLPDFVNVNSIIYSMHALDTVSFASIFSNFLLLDTQTAGETAAFPTARTIADVAYIRIYMYRHSWRDSSASDRTSH